MSLLSLSPRRVIALLAIAIIASACGGEQRTDIDPSPSEGSVTSSTAGSVAPTTDRSTPPTATTPTSPPESTTTTTTKTTTTTTLTPIDAEALLGANCTNCHGDDLQGGVGPSLGAGGHAGEHGIEELIAVITNGRGQMPGWEGILTSEEIVEIARFIGELQDHG